MEAAATRGVHGDARAAARAFTVRARPLGPGRRPDPAVAQPALRRPAAGPARSRRRRRRRCTTAWSRAGKPSPLEPARAGRLGDGPDGPLHAAAAREGARLTAAEAVRRARSVLRRYG